MLTHRLDSTVTPEAALTLLLTADERLRSRYRFEASNGQSVYVHLPRGTVLQDGDLLSSDEGVVVKVVARPEPIMTITAKTTFDLLRAAYHLGNRHVPLEITQAYLRLSPDPVLRDMLEHLGLEITEEVQPFYPERGAYGHSH